MQLRRLEEVAVHPRRLLHPVRRYVLQDVLDAAREVGVALDGDLGVEGGEAGGGGVAQACRERIGAVLARDSVQGFWEGELVGFSEGRGSGGRGRCVGEGRRGCEWRRERGGGDGRLGRERERLVGGLGEEEGHEEGLENE